MTFSERNGLKPVRIELQVDSMSEALRNSLWNVVHQHLDLRNGGPGNLMEVLTERLQRDVLKMPVDELPTNPAKRIAWFRNKFIRGEWYAPYDFIEVLIDIIGAAHPKLASLIVDAVNEVLEREFAGFRLVCGLFVRVTDPLEVGTLEEALADARLPNVNAHLRASLNHLSDKRHPDYRNSIKESISAVEAMAQAVSGEPKATLGDALKLLEKDGKLHAALTAGFSRLYGYTNDAHGIRHAMMDEPGLTAADAKYFLLSCTSFVNYLKSKL